MGSEIPDDLCSLLTSRESDINQLSAADRKTVERYAFTLQKAPTGVARCRLCGVKIDKGDIRCGYPIKDCRGEFGVLVGWTHTECCGPLLRQAFANTFPNDQLPNFPNLLTEDMLTTNLEEDSVAARFSTCVASLFDGWTETPENIQRALLVSALRPEAKEDVGKIQEMLNAAVEKRQLVKRRSAPIDLLVPLLPFQEEGLAWMCDQENTVEMQGGILADEMGMGKTIQTIALLLAQKQELEGTRPSQRGATLVVAPLAAVLQWKQEIERFTRQDSLQVLLYHGACRTALLNELHMYDVVITTYATLESDYRQVLNLHKLPCKYCGRMFLPEKLAFHLRYFCGDDATRTARQAMTEKKRTRAAEKAMRTLDIQTEPTEYQAPTITNVFLSIMKEANIPIPPDAMKAVPWLKGRAANSATLAAESLAQPSHAEEQPGTASTASTSSSVCDGTSSVVKTPDSIGSHRKTQVKREPSGKKSKLKTQVNNQRAKEGVEKQLTNMGFSSECVCKLIEEYPDITAEHAVHRLLEEGAELRVEGQGADTKSLLACNAAKQDSGNVLVGDTLSAVPDEAGASLSAHQNARILREKFGFSKTEIQKKKVSELKLLLRSIDQPTFGTKVELVNRLCLLLFPEEHPPTTAPETASSSQNEDHWDALKKEGVSCTVRNSSVRHSKRSSSLSETTSQDNKKVLRSAARSCKQRKAVIDSTVTRKKSMRKCKTAKRVRFVESEESELSEESSVSSSTVSDVSSSTLSDVSSLEDEISPLPVKKNIGVKARILRKNTKKRVETDLDSSQSADGSDRDLLDVDISLSPLHTIVWDRIVLDEAHRIKGRTTSTAKSVYALQCSGARWCLTGTPLQNRVGELYSLVHFLRMKPYGYYYCQKKGCDCASLHYRFRDNRFCVQCGHARLSHYSWFNRTIVTPIKNYGCGREGREALRILKEVLTKLLLRRTKVERAEDVKLPPLTVLIRRDPLVPAECDFYESLYKQTETQFNTYVDQGTVLHNYAHIFDLLSRLRQAVDHPYLIVYGNLASQTKASAVYLTEAETLPNDADLRQTDVCWLCQDAVDDPEELCVTGCHHTFHRTCLQEYTASAPEDPTQQTLGCPKCFRALTVDRLLGSEATVAVETELVEMRKSQRSTSRSGTTGILSRINLSEFKSSTKIEALVQELESVHQQDADAKCIVFSQYTAMLDLIEWRLKKGGLACAKLVGSLSLESRSNILYAFTTDPALKIILMSLKAGGEGLNLQVANHIFLMDPWWNPATEMQAIQRAHRIGQRKPVRAVRFICEGTIEDKMLQLQEKKQLVFDGTVGANEAAMAKLTAEDLRFLFQN